MNAMESELREQRHWPNDPIGQVKNSVRGHSGGPPLQIVLIDDSADDRLIVRRELEQEFPSARITEIPNLAALEAGLSAGSFDLLVTDFHLFWSDGLTVLKRFTSKWPDLPAIMFTGTGNEMIAVEAMKAGVSDYILKEPRFYSRLRSSARTALESQERRRLMAAAEAKYRQLFDTVPVGLFKCSPDGQLLQANQAFAAIAGAQNPAEALRRNFADLHPEPSEFNEWRRKLERDRSVAFFESRFQTAPGQFRWVEIHARALRDPDSRQTFFEGSVEDITARKEAEQERERLIAELKDAVGKVKSLAGLLPICAACKKIRDDKGLWNMLETYIEKHSLAHFTHSFCPECARELYPEVFLDRPKV